jgi:glycerol-3-phosphate dehydrogenase (NAD(P)+)
VSGKEASTVARIGRVAVIGGGAWGTALALVAARAGRDVALVVRDQPTAQAVEVARENTARLPGVALDRRITAVGDPGVLADADLWLIAMPAQAVRARLRALAQLARPGLAVVITAKGLERTSSRLMTEVLTEELPAVEPLVLSGPSFAADVARGLPTAVTLAARTFDSARTIAEAVSLPTFRPYLSDDLVGVQIGGAVKNVLAIAAGIVSGRRLGDSARAALIARAFAEMMRLGRALGARTETLAGLSGLGDLVLTCSSPTSRNFAYGLALAAGETGAAGPDTRTVEGAWTAAAAVALAARLGVEVPIMRAVEDIVAGRLGIDPAIEALLQRPLKAEF